MNNPPRAMTVANDVTMIEMVASAEQRLILMAPGFSKAVADAIIERWHELDPEAVTVIVDADPEVYRLGYGCFEALRLLESTAAQLGVTLDRQPGIRIGLIISDDETLIYSPTPLLIEAGPRKTVESKTIKPNAIRIGLPPADVERDLGQGPDGVLERSIGLDKAKKADINEVDAELKLNPPQKFDVARKVRVFNAYFEFVDFELIGTFIDRTTVPIPSKLMGVADKRTQQKIKTSFRLIGREDEISGRALFKDKIRISKRFLKVINGYGNVILRTEKEAFLEEVRKLERGVDIFRERVQEKLQAKMDESRAALVQALLPAVRQSPPKEWGGSCLFSRNDATICQFIDEELKSAFGSADRLIKHMSVHYVFKGVTYELLKNEEFMTKAKVAIPDLFLLYDEHDAAKAVEPPIPDSQTRNNYAA